MMNNQQMAMGSMPNAGGPVGGAPMLNIGSRGGMIVSRDNITSLNTYIYDYYIRRGFHDVARAMLKAAKQSDNQMLLSVEENSTGGRDVNGVDGIDSKEDVKRPADLPEAGNNVGKAENCFLEDWWCQFWDLHAGVRSPTAPPAISQYIKTTQQQQMMRQSRQNEMVNSNPAMLYNRMPNGLGNVDMRQAAMMKATGFNPAMMQAQMNPEMRRQMMQRQAQNPNMGEQRSQSPNGNGEAPSPKRQRMDGAFNGQVMGPAGRGQGMPGQPGMGNPAGMMLQNGLPEGFPAGQMQGIKMADGTSPIPPGGAAGDGSNHALQDYQMQLMLLEQQNKKRLLMARQEQDSMAPGQQGQMAQFVGGTGMSPSNSRQGPSPSPADQIKRGTPQLGQKGLPPGSSPATMEAMQANRGSPAPGFDPSNMPPNMQGQFFQGGMNPQMAAQMVRPPSSHPGAFQAHQGMNPQLEFLRQQQAARGQPLPNMMQGQPGPQLGQQMAQHGQPPQAMGTPRQPQGNMPPPPAPATQGEQKTNPSSPSQGSQAAPPTPSTQKGTLPKGNKKEKAAPNKKAGNKKNQQNTAATPASEAEPPTPTPSTPITPMHPNSFNKNGVQPPATANANANTPANAPNAGAAVPGPQNPTPQGSSMDGSAQFDASMDGNLSLELADFGSGDVLENFDFDTFLHNTSDDTFNEFNMDFDHNSLLADGS